MPPHFGQVSAGSVIGPPLEPLYEPLLIAGSDRHLAGLNNRSSVLVEPDVFRPDARIWDSGRTPREG